MLDHIYGENKNKRLHYKIFVPHVSPKFRFNKTNRVSVWGESNFCTVLNEQRAIYLVAIQWKLFQRFFKNSENTFLKHCMHAYSILFVSVVWFYENYDVKCQVFLKCYYCFLQLFVKHDCHQNFIAERFTSIFPKIWSKKILLIKF